MLHVRIVPVLISGSMFIGLDLTSTDRTKRMKGVFLSGRYLFTDFYGNGPFTLPPERGVRDVFVRIAMTTWNVAGKSYP